MLKKILLVDDDYNIQNLLVNYLIMKGFEVETAENGYFALKKLEIFKPDLILLDIMMPRVDGFEVCAKIREIPDSVLSRVPIIVVSALNHLNDVKKAIGAGANDYLVKPLNMQVLFEKINRYIRPAGIANQPAEPVENMVTVEKLDKGVVISVQGQIKKDTFDTFQRNVNRLPQGDFVVLFFQNIKNIENISPVFLQDFIDLFSILSIKKKGLAVEQKDLFVLLEATAIKKKLPIFNTLMEAYEGVKKL